MYKITFSVCTARNPLYINHYLTPLCFIVVSCFCVINELLIFHGNLRLSQADIVVTTHNTRLVKSIDLHFNELMKVSYVEVQVYCLCVCS